MITLKISIIWDIISFIHAHYGYNRCTIIPAVTYTIVLKFFQKKKRQKQHKYGAQLTQAQAVTVAAVAVTTIQIGIDGVFVKDAYGVECGATTLIFKNLNDLTVQTLAIESKEKCKAEKVGDYFIIAYNCVLNV